MSAARPAPPALDHWAALLRKYETLGALRRDKMASGVNAPRAVFRALAREFPGALRELDTLPLDEIDRRAAELSRVVSGAAEPSPWMAWMHAYHATMRAALFLKPRVPALLAHSPEHPRDAFDTLAEEASRRAGISVDAAFAREVARPPEGRLNRVVYRELAARFDVAEDEIAARLFAREPRTRSKDG